MSYDLNLFPARWDADAIRAWFAARPNYEVQDNEIGYLNRDTGVYFSFGLFEADAGQDPEGGPRGPFAAFNMNYMRPHTFGLEAEPEVRAFVEAFGCRVEDPQTGGMGDGPWSSELFLAGWNAGNRFGYQVMAQQGAGGVRVEASRIEAAWRWNFARWGLQVAYDTEQRAAFTPMLMWTISKSGGVVRTAATWTRGVATMIPAAAEAVILVRPSKPSLMSRITGNTGKLRADVALVALSDLLKAVDMERETTPAGAVFVASGLNEVFDAATRGLTFGDNPRAVFDAIAPDQVLNADV